MKQKKEERTNRDIQKVRENKIEKTKGKQTEINRNGERKREREKYIERGKWWSWSDIHMEILIK